MDVRRASFRVMPFGRSPSVNSDPSTAYLSSVKLVG